MYYLDEDNWSVAYDHGATRKNSSMSSHIIIAGVELTTQQHTYYTLPAVAGVLVVQVNLHESHLERASVGPDHSS